MEERLVVVAGTELESYYRREIFPPFELVFAQIAAACQALSAEVRGSANKKVRRCSGQPHASLLVRSCIGPAAAAAAAAVDGVAAQKDRRDPAECHLVEVQRCKAMFGTSWAALRQSLADTMDRALDTYWDRMRKTDPDVILLASQTEVLVAHPEAATDENTTCGCMLCAVLLGLGRCHCAVADETLPRNLTCGRVLCAAPVTDVHLHGNRRHHGAPLSCYRIALLCSMALCLNWQSGANAMNLYRPFVAGEFLGLHEAPLCEVRPSWVRSEHYYFVDPLYRTVCCRTRWIAWTATSRRPSKSSPALPRTAVPPVKRCTTSG